jgi:hypothetical protein
MRGLAVKGVLVGIGIEYEWEDVVVLNAKLDRGNNNGTYTHLIYCMLCISSLGHDGIQCACKVAAREA